MRPLTMTHVFAFLGHRLGVRLACLDPLGSKSPAGDVAEMCLEGSFQDPDKIRELATISDVITVEIEHVDVTALEALERSSFKVHPNSKTLRIIQVFNFTLQTSFFFKFLSSVFSCYRKDKFLQKVHLAAHGVALPDFVSTPTFEAAIRAGRDFGYPFILKNRRMAYDGRGNAVVNSEEDIPSAFEKLAPGTTPDQGAQFDVYAERWIPFTKELAIMVVRTGSGVVSYPVVETVQKDNICHLVLAPAELPSASYNDAVEVAKLAIGSFDGIGIYGVEMFLLPDGSILINEIAPRFTRH